MERLTDKKEADAQRREYENRLKNGYPRNIPEERFLKLAAYEDTGLGPDEITELMAAHGTAILGLSEYRSIGPAKHLLKLAQAEKDGRLVVLPCKLHESIFYLEDGKLFDDEPYEVSLGQKSGEWNDSLMFECQYGFGFFGEDVGKTVFLTREEAEAALRKGEEDNEAD